MIALYFDTETTGIKSRKNPDFIPRLVQLGAILQDLETGRVLAEVNLMAHPEGVFIPPSASHVHGITTDMATDFGLPMTMIDSLFENLLDKCDLVVAHNIAYDLDIVDDNLPLSHRLIKPKPIFCTMESSRYVVKAPLTERQKQYMHLQEHPFKSPNLTETYKYFFGIPFEGAHDAMADIRACRDIFGQLRQQGYYQIIDGRVMETAKMVEARRTQ